MRKNKLIDSMWEIISIDKIIVTTLGVALAFLIKWFFLDKNENAAEEGGDIVNIIVAGGYNPSVIKIKKGKKTTLGLVRTEDNSCLEEFVLWDFKIKKYLPLGERVEISITPNKKGEFAFSCEMNMYHGKVIVS